MPILNTSYRSPYWIKNGHWETIYPHYKRTLPLPDYDREQLELNDGDFLLLDWVKTDSNMLIICSHGLEGSSRSLYARSAALYAAQNGWSYLAWNNRSCGGKMNRLPKLYYHGSTTELNAVIEHAIERGFQKIALIGFSMGGCIQLKWAGSHHLDHVICNVALSAPIDLALSAKSLDTTLGWLYKRTFLQKMKKKLHSIKSRYPDILDWSGLEDIKKWREMDNRFSAPLLGYDQLSDMYYDGSARNFAGTTTTPTLLINAANDPLIDSKSFDIPAWDSHQFIRYEYTKRGGHVGWPQKKQFTWAEERAYAFINQFLK